MQKLKTNKTQILQRNRFRKYNPENHPENSDQEAQWPIDVNTVIPQDDFYTLAWELNFGTHLFEIPIKYADPNASDFDENHTQGPILLLWHAPIFMTQAMVETGKLAPLLTHL